MQTVVETKAFSKRAAEILTADERDELISFLAANPMAGAVIPKTGGVRKLRWQAKNKGTRGGSRVIYYAHDDLQPIFALLVYGKGEADDLSPDEKKALTKLAAVLKAGLKGS